MIFRPSVMSWLSHFTSLLFILVISITVPGQGATPVSIGKMSDADRARFEKLRGEGFDALYNLDYEGARKRFNEISTAFPDHPAGPLPRDVQQRRPRDTSPWRRLPP